MYTIADVIQKTGLSHVAVQGRVHARIKALGPYKRIGVSYVFNARQFKGLCEDWGRGHTAARRHAQIRRSYQRGLSESASKRLTKSE